MAYLVTTRSGTYVTSTLAEAKAVERAGGKPTKRRNPSYKAGTVVEYAHKGQVFHLPSVWLQGIGWVPAKQAKDLKDGDVEQRNYGATYALSNIRHAGGWTTYTMTSLTARDKGQQYENKRKSSTFVPLDPISFVSATRNPAKRRNPRYTVDTRTPDVLEVDGADQFVFELMDNEQALTIMAAAGGKDAQKALKTLAAERATKKKVEKLSWVEDFGISPRTVVSAIGKPETAKQVLDYWVAFGRGLGHTTEEARKLAVRAVRYVSAHPLLEIGSIEDREYALGAARKLAEAMGVLSEKDSLLIDRHAGQLWRATQNPAKSGKPANRGTWPDGCKWRLRKVPKSRGAATYAETQGEWEVSWTDPEGYTDGEFFGSEEAARRYVQSQQNPARRRRNPIAPGPAAGLLVRMRADGANTFTKKVAWVRKHMPTITGPQAFVAELTRAGGEKHRPRRKRK